MFYSVKQKKYDKTMMYTLNDKVMSWILKNEQYQNNSASFATQFAKKENNILSVYASYGQYQLVLKL